MKDEIAPVIILGLGVSGHSAARYLLAQGKKVYAYDQRALELTSQPDIIDLLQQGLQLTDSPTSLEWAYALLSPGFPPSHPVCRDLERRSIPMIGEVEFACRQLPYPMIGVTGTNGKTTVTLQIAHTLNYWNIAALPMGNVGDPLTRLLAEPPPEHTVLVLELSSYQLETLHSRVLDSAVLLNITPDHLDRYGSLDAYAAAKWCISRCLKDGAPLYADWTAWQQADEPPPATLPFGIDAPDSCPLVVHQDIVYSQGTPIGSFPAGMAPYEQHNVLAVYAACHHFGLSLQQIMLAARSFQKPPHRLQPVACLHGIDFYDDSKGTNADAVLKAVQAFPGRRILLIAGGVAKGASFVCWRNPFQGLVIAIYAIGTSAPQLAAELGESFPVYLYPDLPSAVQAAYRNATAGDVVLLSPGCASIDMFRNYAERGLAFQRCVQQLY